MLKKIGLMFGVITVIRIFWVSAASLDGTATPTVIYDHRVFSDGDSIKGYVHFKNGFKVPSGGSITLDIPTEVQGTIELNGGRLILLEDMILASDGQIIGDTSFTSGSSSFRSRIFGNGHTIHLSSDFTLNSILWLNDSLLLTDSRVQLASDNVRYSGLAVASLKFNGRGHRFNLGPDATIFAQSWFGLDGLVNYAGLIRIGFRNVSIIDIYGSQDFPNLDGGSGTYDGAGARLLLENMNFAIKPGNVFGPQGQLEMLNLVRTDRGEMHFTNAIVTIKKDSTCYIGPSTNLHIDSPVYFEEAASSQLFFDSCDVLMNGAPMTAGVTFTGARVFVNGAVAQTGGTLILGDAVSSANDCDFIVLPSSKYILQGTSGLVDKNVSF